MISDREMKRAVITLISLLAAACALRSSQHSQSGSGVTVSLLRIKDITGWKPSGEIESVSSSTDIWKWDDGAEQVFVDHNFVEAARRIYSGKTSNGPVQLRLRVYALQDSASARAAYRDDRSGTGTTLTGSQNPGREARLDDSASQALTLEYWKSRYFVRLVIEENSPQARKVLSQFANNINGKIK
jgi:hypothetical protein